jgi:8-oxo-dGTP diphosphatase
MQKPPPEVAIAILYQPGQTPQDAKLLMQLRDNIPTILYPGYWALFGGHIEPGETPEDAVVREIREEIDYELLAFTKFGVFSDETAVRHVYAAHLNVALTELTLNEGWDLGLVSPAELSAGERYSENAGEVRPIGPMHQRILLAFLADHLGV